MTGPRLLVVGPKLATGGTERHLATVLPAMAARGLDVTYFAFERGGELEPLLLDTHVVVKGPTAGRGGKPARAARAFAGLRREIARRPPDLVHFFLPEPYLVGTLATATARGLHAVMSRRSLATYHAAYPGFRALERAAHRRMAALLGNSSAVGEELVAECGDPAKVGIVHNGVRLPEPLSAAERARLRAGIGVAPDAFVAATVANLIPYKGHADLLDAFARAAPALGPAARLVLIGRDGGVGDALAAQAAALGVADRVLRLGLQPDADRLIGAFDVAVLPSHEEGFSNALIEGLAHGVPTIATAVGGNRDAVVDGETGLLVPPRAPEALAAALMRLAGDPQGAAALGARARAEVARRFGLDEMLARYERLYAAHRLLGTRPVQDLLDGR